MSTNSGVTGDALKAVIIEKLGAQHVVRIFKCQQIETEFNPFCEIFIGS